MKRLHVNYPWLIFIVVLVCTIALVACSGSSTPQQIASYPKDQPKPLAAYISPPAQVVYNAYLDLEVSDVDWAVDQAEDQAVGRGGYLLSSQSWYQDGRKYALVTLAVPVPNFDHLRSALIDLGTLKSESVSGQLVSQAPGGLVNYSQITLQLRPRPSVLPALPSFGWDPARTLESAVRVFVSIFGFIVDLLIWVLVVLGPFALIGWAGWRLIKKLTRPG